MPWSRAARIAGYILTWDYAMLYALDANGFPSIVRLEDIGGCRSGSTIAIPLAHRITRSWS
jgi:hypothetical protein